jgi:hypothetical protein
LAALKAYAAEVETSRAMTEPLSDFEQTVLDKLLAGNHPRSAELRQQAAGLCVVERELTAVGFFVTLAVAPGIPPVNADPDFAISEVYGELEGLEHGAGFVVFIVNGYLETLEGFTYVGLWPERIGAYRLYNPEELRGLEFSGE